MTGSCGVKTTPSATYSAFSETVRSTGRITDVVASMQNSFVLQSAGSKRFATAVASLGARAI